jgi:hypothetical protein
MAAAEGGLQCPTGAYTKAYLCHYQPGDGVDAGDARKELVVKVIDVVAKNGGQAHAGDDDALLRIGFALGGAGDHGHCRGWKVVLNYKSRMWESIDTQCVGHG